MDSDEDWVTVDERKQHVHFKQGPRQLNTGHNTTSRLGSLLEEAQRVRYGAPDEGVVDDASSDAVQQTVDRDAGVHATALFVPEGIKVMCDTLKKLQNEYYGDVAAAKKVISSSAEKTAMMPVVDPRFFPASRTTQFITLCTSMCNRLDENDFYAHPTLSEDHHYCFDDTLARACLDAYVPFVNGDNAELFRPVFHGAMAEARMLLEEDESWGGAVMKRFNVVNPVWEPELRLWQNLLRAGGFSADTVLREVFDALDVSDDLEPLLKAIGLRRTHGGGGHHRADAWQCVEQLFKDDTDWDVAAPKFAARFGGNVVHDEEQDTDFATPIEEEMASLLVRLRKGLPTIVSEARGEDGESVDGETAGTGEGETAGGGRAHKIEELVGEAAFLVLQWYDEYFFPIVVFPFLKRSKSGEGAVTKAINGDTIGRWDYKRHWMYVFSDVSEVPWTNLKLPVEEHRLKNFKGDEDDLDLDDVCRGFQQRIAEKVCRAVVEGRGAYIDKIKSMIPKVPRLLSDDTRRRLYTKLVADVVNLNSVKNPRLHAMVQRGERLGALNRSVEAIVHTYRELSGKKKFLPW